MVRFSIFDARNKLPDDSTVKLGIRYRTMLAGVARDGMVVMCSEGFGLCGTHISSAGLRGRDRRIQGQLPEAGDR